MHGQVVEVDLEHGDVGFDIGAHDTGPHLAAVLQLHFDLGGVFHHVVVGEQVALGRNDHARAQPYLLLLRGPAVAEEELEARVVGVRAAPRHLGGCHAHHGRRGTPRRRGIAAVGALGCTGLHR
jgi:hypothetical protein